MINRINLILRVKNITAKQFAEEIGIQPSGMSHILGGRNNPSLEFVTKVLRRYPEIDANWLLFGKGQMYLSDKNDAVEAPREHVPYRQDEDLFSSQTQEPVNQNVVSEPIIDNHIAEALRESVENTIDIYNEQQPLASDDLNERRITHMVLVYSDGTFEDFSPSRG